MGHVLPVATWDHTEDTSRLAESVDFCVCLGGDGAILHASYLFRRHCPPVIAFNLGSLGFLANHDFASFREDLGDMIHGRAHSIGALRGDSSDEESSGRPRGATKAVYGADGQIRLCREDEGSGSLSCSLVNTDENGLPMEPLFNVVRCGCRRGHGWPALL